MNGTEALARDKLLLDYNVSRETIDRMEAYRLLLVKWATQINLVGPSTLNHFWERHALDCAQLLPIIGSEVRSVADFGSGAGFPGLVLAALQSNIAADFHMTLVEASGKRCGFLREATRALGVNVSIIHNKIEAVSPQAVDVVTARAFAPLSKLLTYAHPWAQLGARIVFLKGGDVQREIDEASTNWSFQSRLNASVSDSRGCIVEILERL
jgi:16S rRNA (guanine527-N7)-methyltransferase